MSALPRRPPPSYTHVQFGDTIAHISRDPSREVFLNHCSKSSFDYENRYNDTMLPHSSRIDGVNIGYGVPQGPFSVPFPSNLMFETNNHVVSLSLVKPTQGHAPWVSAGLDASGPRFAEDPVMAMEDVLLQNSNEVYCGSTALESTFDLPPASHATYPNQRTSPVAQRTEEGVWNTTDPSAIVGARQSGAMFPSANVPTPNLAEPTVMIGGSLYHAENDQVVYSEPEATRGPYYDTGWSGAPQTILSGEPTYQCQWQDLDGTLCLEEFTCTLLPGHLANHGIKNQTRHHPTECRWLGCKAKKVMNRESIVRHIREVHLGLRRRPSKRSDSHNRELSCQLATMLEAVGSDFP